MELLWRCIREFHTSSLVIGHFHNNSFQGPEPVRNVLLDVIKKSFLAIPGAKFWRPEDRSEPHSVLHTRAKTLQGIPSLDELRWVNRPVAGF